MTLLKQNNVTPSVIILLFKIIRIKILGQFRISSLIRQKLFYEFQNFNNFIKKNYQGVGYSPMVIKNAFVQPFQDLLNRPAGGDAYCGGVVFRNPEIEPVLHHFRRNRSIDRPLTTFNDHDEEVQSVAQRLFWCGPITFHFGHQIADFGSRVLLSSLDLRDGDLLWYPWRAASDWQDLQSWQKFLLSYLNPGHKKHRICVNSIQVSELVVYPQQARMHSAPTYEHLEALCWCERSLKANYQKVVYVSRSRFAPCNSPDSLLGSFAGEELFVNYLISCGVSIVYPEDISLEQQLEIYLGAEILIFAEGSAQHGLELLGFHPNKNVFIICRRPQKKGMSLPLESRFPKVCFIEAIVSQWTIAGSYSWDALALLDWTKVASTINPFLDKKITNHECELLQRRSYQQISELARASNLLKL